MKIMHGDIFTSTAQALVNPVNCVGVMGKGLALEFKKRFPDNFMYYKAVCDRGYLQPGVPLFHNPLAERSEHEDDEAKIIINFPTKDHWRNPSKVKWIEEGLLNMVDPIFKYAIKSVALPMLGCGLGGLDEGAVERLIENFSLMVPGTEVELWKPK